MSENEPEEHVEGKRYPAGARVIFRGQVYEAQWRTEVRPRLTRSWRLVEGPG